MLDEGLTDPSSVQSYHVPCEPALMGLAAGRPLVDCLTSKLVDRLTAKLMNFLTNKLLNCLTAKLMNRLTCKPVDPLTTRLVVVNLVKLHLTKCNFSL